MVNDFRCHLANLSPTVGFTGGEVFVPSTYIPREPDRFEQTIRSALFGMRPDRHMVNYRCFQFLRLLAGSTWRSVVTDNDPRITYDPWIWPGPQVEWDQVKITQSPTDLLLIGQIVPNDAEGIVLDHYEILIGGGSTANIFRSGTLLNTATFTMSGGSTNPIKLGASGLSFVFNSTPSVGMRYSLDVSRKPSFSTGDIEITVHQSVDSGSVAAVMAGNDLAGNLWYRSRSTQARLCGLIIGLVNYARTRT